MPIPGHLQAVRIKLNELQRQRDRLVEHYAGVEQRAAEAPTPLQRLQVFYDGLRKARFAQKPLHPEVANLEGLFLAGQLGLTPPDLIHAWLVRLERELTQGRLRAEFALAFGRLLEEPAGPPEDSPAPIADGDTQEETPADLAFLDQLLDAWPPATLAGLRQTIQYDAVAVRLAATDPEVKAVLTLLLRDATRPAELRRQASSVLARPSLIHEYAGVLTILLDNLTDWDWPADGLARRVVSLRDKPRLFLDEDLVTALFLQLIGLRWGIRLKTFCSQYQGGETLLAASDPPGLSYIRQQRTVALFLSMIPANESEWLRGGGYYGNVLEEQLRLLQADIRFHRAAAPEKPLIVVQTDLRDFYPRLSHAALLHLVERLGFPPLWVNFLRKYLRVKVRTAEGVRGVRRGVLLDHRLGDVLAELFLLLLDRHVIRQCGVRLFRVVDDVVFLTHDAETARKTWQTIEEFCRQTGLEINTDKSGAITLNGPMVEGLPVGPPRWGLLQLTSDGGWRLDEPRFDRLQDWARRHVQAGGSTLGMVRRYNDAMRFLLGCLGLTVDLGPGHLDAVSRRLGQFQQDLFGPGQGIAGELRRRLEKHFRDGPLQERSVPEALLYWPITAGGLGLVQPLLSLTGYRKGRTETVPESTPPGSRLPAGADVAEQQRWVHYYQLLLRTLPHAAPAPTPAAENLVRDFIARGSEVAGRRQQTLRPYWQWVLATYGPALLESLGTFRFLLTELVPLGLIFTEDGASDASDFTEDAGQEDNIPF